MSIDKDLNSGSLAALVNQASGTNSKCDIMEDADDGKALPVCDPVKQSGKH